MKVEGGIVRASMMGWQDPGKAQVGGRLARAIVDDDILYPASALVLSIRAMVRCVLLAKQWMCLKMWCVW